MSELGVARGGGQLTHERSVTSHWHVVTGGGWGWVHAEG